MTWLRRHPGDRRLNRFADGELGERDHAAVSAHLAACARCREEVALVRRMRDLARTLPSPIATDEVLRRALARRSAGERVLLPMSDAGAPRRQPSRRLAPLATAAMVTLLVAGLIMSVRVLEADRPALRLHPERPTAGETLRVEYRGGSLFADQSHLALRGRYRTAEDRHWQLLSGILVRGDDGLYRAEVHLPDSVVYAAFAVEDLYGERLDSNNRELWDVMIHGRDGKPTLEGMLARALDLEPRDWGEAYAQALRLTETYPDAPQSWAARFSFEIGLFERDSVHAAHQAHLARLEDMVTRSRDPGAMAWLGIYAVDLGDLERAEHWIMQAKGEAGVTSAVSAAESMLLLIRNSANLAGTLPSLERLWEEPRGRNTRVAHAGWQAAVATKDPEAILRWSDRYLEQRPLEHLTVIPVGYLAPELRPRLLAWARGFTTDPDRWLETERPLRLPADRHVRREAQRLQRSLAEGAAFVARDADQSSARTLAEIGSDLAWDSRALMQISTILNAAGAREAALDALARAAADPIASGAAKAMASTMAAPSDWSHRVSQATDALRTYVLQEAVVRDVRPGLRMLRGAERLTFAEAHRGLPSVVVFLSRYCIPALEDAAALPALAVTLEELGAQLLVLNVDNTPDLVNYLKSIGYEGPVYTDDRGQLRSAFQSSSTADFYVVDASGRVRFEHSLASDVVRQIWALQETAAVAASVSE